MQNQIRWFEIPVSDMARAKTFYQQVFDTKLTDVTLANGLQMAMFPGDEHTVSGALCCHPGFYKPSMDGTLVYFNADPSISKILDRINTAGGSVIVPQTKLSDTAGSMAVFTDSEGNRVALHSNE
jgi:predicted enzyme related to lactoylglutathione lyase